MKAARNLQLQTLLLLLLTTFTAAWPVWPRWLPELDSLIVRQNSNSNQDNSASSTPTGSASGAQQTQTRNAATLNPSGTASGSGSASGSGGSSITVIKSGSGTKTSSTPKITSFDPRLPAGGVSMLEPAVTSGAQYFKIGDFVTFAWNYTSLSVTPTAVNVMATCTANQVLYTIAANATIPGNATQAVTWDTGAYQSTAAGTPLLTETYTLVIFDAQSSISATAAAGYLAPYEQYTFGMYVPQSYTPLNEFVCVTCSAALSQVERRALGVVVAAVVGTVVGFTWFVTGTGIIW